MALENSPPRSRGRSVPGVSQSDKHRLLRCAVSGTKGANRALADGPLGDCGQSATADFEQAQEAEGFYACVPRKWLSKGHQGDA